MTAVHGMAATSAAAIPKLPGLLYGAIEKAIGEKQNEMLKQIVKGEISHPMVSFATSIRDPLYVGTNLTYPMAATDLGIKTTAVTGPMAYAAKKSKDQFKGTIKRRWNKKSEAGSEIRVPLKRNREEDIESGLAKRMKHDKDLVYV
jgi:hypothetical protein